MHFGRSGNFFVLRYYFAYWPYRLTVRTEPSQHFIPFYRFRDTNEGDLGLFGYQKQYLDPAMIRDTLEMSLKFLGTFYFLINHYFILSHS